MRVLTIVVLAVSLILLGVSIQATMKSNTAIANSLLPPTGRTGAPGDVGTCITCHAGDVGTPDGGIIIVPQHSATEYVPGATDTISVVIGDPGQYRWGFEATVLKNSDNSMAGTLANVADFQIYTGIQSSGGRMYASHTSNGATAAFDPTDGTFWGLPFGIGWIFEWTAPPPGSGPVTIYVAGVAADSSKSANGTDYTYTNALVLSEAGATPVTTTTWGKIKKRYP
jgi:hypothetical protein